MKEYTYQISVWLLAVFCCTPSMSFSQDNKRTGTHLYLLTSIINGEATVHRTGHFAFAGGIDIDRSVGRHFGVCFRSSYRNWTGRQKSVIPFDLGPSYRIHVQDDLTLSFIGGAGPVAVLGNDYAGFFAHFNLGLRLETYSTKKVGISGGLSISEAMAFHGSAFRYFDIFVGVRL